jgi:hypothetical protein
MKQYKIQSRRQTNYHACVPLSLLFLSRAKFPLVSGKTYPRRVRLGLYPASPILMYH